MGPKVCKLDGAYDELLEGWCSEGVDADGREWEALVKDVQCEGSCPYYALSGYDSETGRCLCFACTSSDRHRTHI